MILLSANGNNKFGIAKAVFVTTNVRLGKSRIFIKDVISRTKLLVIYKTYTNYYILLHFY